MTEIVSGNLSEGRRSWLETPPNEAGGSSAIASQALLVVAGWIQPLHTALAGLANR